MTSLLFGDKIFLHCAKSGAMAWASTAAEPQLLAQRPMPADGSPSPAMTSQAAFSGASCYSECELGVFLLERIVQWSGGETAAPITDSTSTDPVFFGNLVRIRHASTGMVLCSRRTSLRSSDCTVRIEEERLAEGASVWRVASPYKIRLDGESISYGDHLVLLSETLRMHLDMTSGGVTGAELTTVASGGGGDGGRWLARLQLKPVPLTFQVFEPVQAFSHLAKAGAVLCGQSMLLFHKDQLAFLSCATGTGIAEGNTSTGDTATDAPHLPAATTTLRNAVPQLLSLTFPRIAEATYKVSALPYEATCLWLPELATPTDGAALCLEPECYRIRNVTTSRYLTVSEDGSAVVFEPIARVLQLAAGGMGGASASSSTFPPDSGASAQPGDRSLWCFVSSANSSLPSASIVAGTTFFRIRNAALGLYLSGEGSQLTTAPPPSTSAPNATISPNPLVARPTAKATAKRSAPAVARVLALATSSSNTPSPRPKDGPNSDSSTSDVEDVDDPASIRVQPSTAFVPSSRPASATNVMDAMGVSERLRYRDEWLFEMSASETGGPATVEDLPLSATSSTTASLSGIAAAATLPQAAPSMGFKPRGARPPRLILTDAPGYVDIFCAAVPQLNVERNLRLCQQHLTAVSHWCRLVREKKVVADEMGQLVMCVNVPQKSRPMVRFLEKISGGGAPPPAAVSPHKTAEQLGDACEAAFTAIHRHCKESAFNQHMLLSLGAHKTLLEFGLAGFYPSFRSLDTAWSPPEQTATTQQLPPNCRPLYSVKQMSSLAQPLAFEALDDGDGGPSNERLQSGARSSDGRRRRAGQGVTSVENQRRLLGLAFRVLQSCVRQHTESLRELLPFLHTLASVATAVPEAATVVLEAARMFPVPPQLCVTLGEQFFGEAMKAAPAGVSRLGHLDLMRGLCTSRGRSLPAQCAALGEVLAQNVDFLPSFVPAVQVEDDDDTGVAAARAAQGAALASPMLSGSITFRWSEASQPLTMKLNRLTRPDAAPVSAFIAGIFFLIAETGGRFVNMADLGWTDDVLLRSLGGLSAPITGGGASPTRLPWPVSRGAVRWLSHHVFSRLIAAASDADRAGRSAWRVVRNRDDSNQVAEDPDEFGHRAAARDVLLLDVTTSRFETAEAASSALSDFSSDNLVALYGRATVSPSEDQTKLIARLATAWLEMVPRLLRQPPEVDDDEAQCFSELLIFLNTVVRGDAFWADSDDVPPGGASPRSLEAAAWDVTSSIQLTNNNHPGCSSGREAAGHKGATNSATTFTAPHSSWRLGVHREIGHHAVLMIEAFMDRRVDVHRRCLLRHFQRAVEAAHHGEDHGAVSQALETAVMDARQGFPRVHSDALGGTSATRGAHQDRIAQLLRQCAVLEGETRSGKTTPAGSASALLIRSMTGLVSRLAFPAADVARSLRQSCPLFFSQSSRLSPEELEQIASNLLQTTGSLREELGNLSVAPLRDEAFAVTLFARLNELLQTLMKLLRPFVTITHSPATTPAKGADAGTGTPAPPSVAELAHSFFGRGAISIDVDRRLQYTMLTCNVHTATLELLTRAAVVKTDLERARPLCTAALDLLTIFVSKCAATRRTVAFALPHIAHQLISMPGVSESDSFWRFFGECFAQRDASGGAVEGLAVLVDFGLACRSEASLRTLRVVTQHCAPSSAPAFLSKLAHGIVSAMNDAELDAVGFSPPAAPGHLPDEAVAQDQGAFLQLVELAMLIARRASDRLMGAAHPAMSQLWRDLQLVGNLQRTIRVLAGPAAAQAQAPIAGGGGGGGSVGGMLVRLCRFVNDPPQPATAHHSTQQRGPPPVLTQPAAASAVLLLDDVLSLRDAVIPGWIAAHRASFLAAKEAASVAAPDVGGAAGIVYSPLSSPRSRVTASPPATASAGGGTAAFEGVPAREMLWLLAFLFAPNGPAAAYRRILTEALSQFVDHLATTCGELARAPRRRSDLHAEATVLFLMEGGANALPDDTLSLAAQRQDTRHSVSQLLAAIAPSHSDDAAAWLSRLDDLTIAIDGPPPTPVVGSKPPPVEHHQGVVPSSPRPLPRDHYWAMNPPAVPATSPSPWRLSKAASATPAKEGDGVATASSFEMDTELDAVFRRISQDWRYFSDSVFDVLTSTDEPLCFALERDEANATPDAATAMSGGTDAGTASVAGGSPDDATLVIAVMAATSGNRAAADSAVDTTVRLLSRATSFPARTVVTLLQALRSVLLSCDEDSLVATQNGLNAARATPLVSRLLEHPDLDVVEQAVEFGVALLEGGNKLCQDTLLYYFNNNDEKFFFTIRQLLKAADQEISHLADSFRKLDLSAAAAKQQRSHTALSSTAKEEEMAASAGGADDDVGVSTWSTIGDAKIRVVELAPRLCRLLQLLCEGHHFAFQNYVRHQHDNFNSYNMCVVVMELLHATLRRPDATTMPIAMQALNTLTEFCQGPSTLNQSAIMNTDVISEINAILSFHSPSASDSTSGTARTATDKPRDDACEAGPPSGGGDDASTGLKSAAVTLLTALLEGSQDARIPNIMLATVNFTALFDLLQEAWEAHELDLGFQIHIFMAVVFTYGDRIKTEPLKQRLQTSGGYEYFTRMTCHIEVWRDDDPSSTRLETVYFRQPDICTLRHETKEYLHNTVNRSSIAAKHSGFFRCADDLIFEMEYQSILEEHANGKPWHRNPLNVLACRPRPFENALLILTGLSNMLILGGFVTHEWSFAAAALGVAAFLCSAYLAIVQFALKGPLFEHRRRFKVDEAPFLSLSASERLHAVATWPILSLVLDETTTKIYIFCTMVSLLSIAASPIFYSFLIVVLIHRFPLLGSIVSAITKNGRQLLLTALLGVCVVYLCAIVGFLYFQTDFARDAPVTTLPPLGNATAAGTDSIVDHLMNSFLSGDVTVANSINSSSGVVVNMDRVEPSAAESHVATVLETNCATVSQCFFYIFSKGVRGGSLADGMVPNEWSDGAYFWREMYDSVFYLVVTVIIMNIVFALIVDTFAELRDARKTQEEDMQTCCFICGIDAATFDRSGEGFAVHVKGPHNMWRYLYFMHHLKRKEQSEYTGQESYVFEKMKRNDLSFFPVNRSRSLENVKLAGADGPSAGGATESGGGLSLDDIRKCVEDVVSKKLREGLGSTAGRDALVSGAKPGAAGVGGGVEGADAGGSSPSLGSSGSASALWRKARHRSLVSLRPPTYQPAAAGAAPPPTLAAPPVAALGVAPTDDSVTAAARSALEALQRALDARGSAPPPPSSDASPSSPPRSLAGLVLRKRDESTIATGTGPQR